MTAVEENEFNGLIQVDENYSSDDESDAPSEDENDENPAENHDSMEDLEPRPNNALRRAFRDFVAPEYAKRSWYKKMFGQIKINNRVIRIETLAKEFNKVTDVIRNHHRVECNQNSVNDCSCPTFNMNLKLVNTCHMITRRGGGVQLQRKREINWQEMKAFTSDKSDRTDWIDGTSHLYTIFTDLHRFLPTEDQGRVCFFTSNFAEFVNTGHMQVPSGTSSNNRGAGFGADNFNHPALREYFETTRTYQNSSENNLTPEGKSELKSLLDMKRKIDFDRTDQKMWIFPVRYMSTCGQHWVTVYVDFENKIMGYIDRKNHLRSYHSSASPIKTIEDMWTRGFAIFLQRLFYSYGNMAHEFTAWEIKIEGKNSFEECERQIDGYNCGVILIIQAFMLAIDGKLDKFGVYGQRNEFDFARQFIGAYLWYRCSNKNQLLDYGR